MNSNLDQRITDSLQLEFLGRRELKALKRATLNHPWITLTASFAIGVGLGSQISSRGAKTLGMACAQVGLALLNLKSS